MLLGGSTVRRGSVYCEGFGLSSGLHRNWFWLVLECGSVGILGRDQGRGCERFDARR